VAHEDYKALLSETMCKGPKAYPGFTDKNGAEIAKVTLQDGDWLVFAWSEHGDQGMNTHPIFSADGNVTTGYLIEASGDYPVAWLSHEPSIKSDVYPLAECLQKRYFSENKQGKVDLVFRYKGAQ
jgi:hypothetical protein